MRHLCLYVDVDIDWQKTPESIRKAILARISGDEVDVDESILEWSRHSAVDFRVADFALNLCLQIHQISQSRLKSIGLTSTAVAPDSSTQSSIEIALQIAQKSSPILWLQVLVRGIVRIAKWVAVLTSGASEVERELWYALRGAYFHQFILRLLLAFWRVCWYMRNFWIRVFIISRRPILAKIATMAAHGASRVLCRNMITVEMPGTAITGFAYKNVHGNIQLQMYEGTLQESPENTGPKATAIYDEDNRLVSRSDMSSSGETTSTFNFGSGKGRWPLFKDISEPTRKLRCQYDKSGRIVSGHITLAQEQYTFVYHYKKYPRHNSQLLRADYRLVGSPDRSLFISWCHSSGTYSGDEVDYDAVPSEKVTRVVRNIGEKKYTTRYAPFFNSPRHSFLNAIHRATVGFHDLLTSISVGRIPIKAIQSFRTRWLMVLPFIISLKYPKFSRMKCSSSSSQLISHSNLTISSSTINPDISERSSKVSTLRITYWRLYEQSSHPSISLGSRIGVERWSFKNYPHQGCDRSFGDCG